MSYELRRPILNEGVHADVAPSEGVVLYRGLETFSLPHVLYARLVPYLSGAHSADEIVDALAVVHDEAEVYAALLQLERRGLVREARSSEHAPRGGSEIQPTATGRAVPRTIEVTLDVFGAVPVEPLRSVLEEAGISVGEKGEVTIVLVDDYLRPELDALNHRFHDEGHPWILAKAAGSVIWVGPLILPGKTACWRCLSHRLRGHRPEFEVGTERPGTDGFDEPVIASLVHVAASLLVRDLATWASGAVVGRAEAVTAIDARDGVMQDHLVVRRPQCTVCGDSTLYPQTVRASVGSWPATVMPKLDHSARLESLVDAVTGLVSEIVPVPNDGMATSVQIARGCFTTSGHTSGSARTKRTVGVGRGPTAAGARLSALAESVERYCGMFEGDEPRIRARYTDLGAEAIHPNQCMLFSDVQYCERAAWNARHHRFASVPPPFNEHTTVEWTPVQPVSGGSPRYLPTMYLYFGYPTLSKDRWCPADSNGAAAWDTVEGAIVQGMLELIERDCVALWWYNRLRRQRVDLDRVDDPYCTRVREAHAASGRELWALDLTSDLSVPCVAVISRSTTGPTERIVFGFSAHVDPVVALTRAMAEHDQVFAIQQATDAGAGSMTEAVRRWLDEATVAAHPYLLPGPAEAMQLDACANRAGDAMTIVLDRLAEQGMQAFVLNQTRPDVALPVVKTVVPGLRHFWARFAPGRLFDVPVRMGWRREPVAERDLNPVPLFV